METDRGQTEDRSPRRRGLWVNEVDPFGYGLVILIYGLTSVIPVSFPIPRR